VRLGSRRHRSDPHPVTHRGQAGADPHPAVDDDLALEAVANSAIESARRAVWSGWAQGADAVRQQRGGQHFAFKG
jgi:hypothetical protein